MKKTLHGGEMRRTLAAVSLAVLSALGLTSNLFAQQSVPTITGRVTDAGTGQPVQDARVLIVGTTLFAIAGPDGRYTVRNVPTGTVQVRVLRVGFKEQLKPAQVSGAEAVTLDFAMQVAVFQLAEVVTTATGEQRRVELGHSVANIGVSNVVETQPVRSISDVLNARVPGVTVASGMQAGVG